MIQEVAKTGKCPYEKCIREGCQLWDIVSFGHDFRPVLTKNGTLFPHEHFTCQEAAIMKSGGNRGEKG